MNLISVVAVTGALLGALLAIALVLVKGRNRMANKILAIFAIIVSLHFVLLAPLLNHHAFDRHLHPIFLNDVFLFGPLLYFYIVAMTQPAFRFRAKYLLHLLPFASALAIELVLTGQSDSFVELERAGARGWPPSQGALIALGFYASFICYLGVSLRRLQMHKRWVADHFSWLEGVSLRWLWLLISATLALSCVGLSLSVIRLFVDMTFLPRGGYSMIMLIALFHLIAFMAIWQPAIFHAETFSAQSFRVPTVRSEQGEQAPIVVSENTEPPVSSERVPKYETSALDAEHIRRYWAQLCALMAKEKPYLNNELRLAQLAEQLAMPAHHLSQVINQSAGQHFLEFVNGYRIEAAKNLLCDEKYRDKKMLTLAFDAGFNSQSAFYKQFKKHVGMTPQQYREKLQSSVLLAVPPR